MIKRLLPALLLAFIGAAWFFCISLPWPVLLRWRNPEQTSFMELRLAQAEAKGDTLRIRHTWVPLAEISRNLRRAVVVAEDARFFDHNGIDWGALAEELHYAGDKDFSWTDTGDLKALAGAFRYYASHRETVRGRSTLTQQLAKNLYFGEERALTRKIGELIVARRLERFLSKDRILELYLNSVEWGPGIFGAEAAARHYFGIPAARLTADQAAALAATLPHPLTSNPNHRPGRMQWRKRLILARMGASGPVETVPLEPDRGEPADTAQADTIPQADTVPQADTITGADTSVQADTMPLDTAVANPVPDTTASEPLPHIGNLSPAAPVSPVTSEYAIRARPH